MSARVAVGRSARFGAIALVGFALASNASCKKSAPVVNVDAAVDASGGASSSSFDADAILRAEDQRRAKDLPESARTSHDVAQRRLVARALARIADDASTPGLMRALEDEDRAVASWGAYGLGAACKGHEDAHVRALAARAASMTAVDGGDAPAVDATGVIARALGKCGGEVAERVLASWLKDARLAARAAYALGDVAAKRNALGDETTTALLDAAAGNTERAPLGVALYPFARMEKAPDAFAERLLATARAALARPGDARIFAVRDLARVGAAATADLVKIAKDKSFSAAERAEAAHGLANRHVGKDGRAGAAEAIAYLVPDKDPIGIPALGGAEYGVMTSLLAAVGVDAPKKTESALAALANLATPANASASLSRRIATLRCTSASILARGAYDTEVLTKCDAEGSEAWERARLASLVQRHPLSGERRAAWLALAQSKHLRVQEAALEAVGTHPELGEQARVALSSALASKKPGLVATAAEQIHAHPDRVYKLAASEIRAALDPSNTAPPTNDPKRELDPRVAKALVDALAHAWPEDLVETRAALLDAGIAVGVREAKDAALVACRDPNATMRQRAGKALMNVADVTVACTPPDSPAPPAAEIGHTITKPTTVRFDTSAGELAIRFEPELAPIAVTRFVALARSGFYDGVVVHRVVPGFVVQLGDPGGDGYGGSGKLLRCETSPVPFEPLDVGVALAGRDTGSSQLFVTLARTPHLDGDYARVGHAIGEWAAVAEGDVIGTAVVPD